MVAIGSPSSSRQSSSSSPWCVSFGEFGGVWGGLGSLKEFGGFWGSLEGGGEFMGFGGFGGFGEF